MKTIITGYNGFVGENLIPYLIGYGIDVIKVGRKDLQQFQPSVFQNSNVIIHLAGKAHDLKNIFNSDEYYKVNFELTKELYDAFLASDAKKFIFVSSVKAAADSVDEVLTEELLPNPQTHYGKSKLMAERYIQTQVLPEGKAYYILRPCMIHGPGNKGNLNLLYKFVQKGFPYPLAAFKNKRSFLSIANLNYIIQILISNSDIPKGVYNIADDCSLSTNEVIQIISEANGNEARLWKINALVIQSIAKIGDKLKLPLNSERLKKLTESYVVSNEKIKKALKIKSLPVSSSEGLLATIKSFTSI